MINRTPVYAQKSWSLSWTSVEQMNDYSERLYVKEHSLVLGKTNSLWGCSWTVWNCRIPLLAAIENPVSF